MKGSVERYPSVLSIGRWCICGYTAVALLLNPAVLVPLFLASMTVGLLVGVWLPWSEPYLVVALVAVLVLTLVLSILVATKMAVLLAVVSYDWRKRVQKRIKTTIRYLENLHQALDDDNPDMEKLIDSQSSARGAVSAIGEYILDAYMPLLVEQGRSGEIRRLTMRVLGYKVKVK
jgi:hypothetical protein